MNAHTDFASTDFKVYSPSTSLWSKLARRAVKYQHQRKLVIKTEKPLVSFSFDDCPQSVFENALPALEKRGWHGTIYAAMGLCGTSNHLGLHMSEAEMKSASKSGHEIADHTFSHLDANAVAPEIFLKDIAKNRAAFERLGLPRARNFAYPYGEVNASVKEALAEQFSLMRGIHSPIHSKTMDLNQAATHRLYSGEDFLECRKAIRGLKETPSWLILFTHDVRDNPSPFGCTPSEFQTILKDVETIGADVLPVQAALDVLREAK
jgi:peptidoglycan/xylan/chitin deacetylase (PgdA/CDA1 family)